MKLKIQQGSTSQLAAVFIQDSSATDGSGLTGLAYNSSGLTWYWFQAGDASPTQVTPATATVGTWASGGFVEVDSTNMPGVYEIGIPDAAINAAGITYMMLKGATDMAPVLIEIECDEIGYQSATQVTADLSAAAVQAARSEMDSNSTQLALIVEDTAELQGDWTDGGRLDLLLDGLITEIDTATAEPGQGAPAATLKRGQKLDYLYKWARNKVEQTATERKHYADDGTTVDHKSTVSDDGSTFTRGEMATGA